MTKSEFQEFRIGDLFKVELSSGDNKPTELPAGDIPLVTAGLANNGICAYVSKGDGKAQLFDAGLITVDMFGNSFYQPKNFYAVSHGRINVLRPISSMNKEASLYVASSMRHFAKMYSFSLMLTSKRLADETIMLPVTSAGSPDYEYMADYVRQIQADYVRQIQAYLKVTGLTDTVLTEAERNTLQTPPIRFKEYKLAELFDIAPTKAYKDMAGFGLGSTPFVSNTSSNNGVVNYFDKPANNPANIITFSDTTDSDKTFFYQPKEFIGFAHIQAMKPKFENMNQYVAMFMISKMKKAIVGKYNYGTKFNRNTANQVVIELPVTSAGDLDIAYMEAYIRATQKQVISNLVDWNAKNVEALEKAIN